MNRLPLDRRCLPVLILALLLVGCGNGTVQQDAASGGDRKEPTAAASDPMAAPATTSSIDCAPTEMRAMPTTFCPRSTSEEK